MTTAISALPLPDMFGISGTYRVFRRWTGLESIDRLCTWFAQKISSIRSRSARKEALRLELAFICERLTEHYNGLGWYKRLQMYGYVTPERAAAAERLAAATPVLQAQYRRVFDDYKRLLPPPPKAKRLEVMCYKEGNEVYEIGFLETVEP